MHKSQYKLINLACNLTALACEQHACYPGEVFSSCKRAEVLTARKIVIEVLDKITGWRYKTNPIPSKEHIIRFIGDKEFDQSTRLPDGLLAKIFQVDRKTITYTRKHTD